MIAMAGTIALLTAGAPAPRQAAAPRQAQANRQAPAPPRATQGGSNDPASPLAGVADYLSSRQGTVQVALYNRRTGRTYLLANGSATQYTASIVKAGILAMWLRRYQRGPGLIPAAIPYSIRFLMTNMITMSDNSAATGLFYFGGGCVALTAFNRLIPTRSTNVGCQTPTYYGWGNTTTTAADQVRIVRTLAYPNTVLTGLARSYGLRLMESVTPSQRWGVSCGPWGTSCDPPDYATPVPGITVALKNGWKYVPSCAAQDDHHDPGRVEDRLVEPGPVRPVTRRLTGRPPAGTVGARR